MIKFENVSVAGFEAAIRGMRNPKNSWAKSDSHPGLCGDEWAYDPGYVIGPNDKELMLKLNKGGPVHAKYRRQIIVWVDITAPLYWWKEFDTYRFGRERNSCSTMHKIAEREFTLGDFSNEHLDDYDLCAEYVDDGPYVKADFTSMDIHRLTIKALNYWINEYLKAVEAKDTERAKHCWWQLIQLNPDCYNQRATIMMSYEVLANIRKFRKNHKLDEWADSFMEFIDKLPYSWIITGEDEEVKDILLEAADLSESKTTVIQGTPLEEDNRDHFVIMVSSGEDKLPVEFLRHDPEKPYKMTLYLDGCEIGDLYAATEPEFQLPAMKVVKLDFVIRNLIGPGSFLDRVRTLQDDYNQGKLRYVIDYVPTRDEFRLMLASW